MELDRDTPPPEYRPYVTPQYIAVANPARRCLYRLDHHKRMQTHDGRIPPQSYQETVWSSTCGEHVFHNPGQSDAMRNMSVADPYHILDWCRLHVCSHVVCDMVHDNGRWVLPYTTTHFRTSGYRLIGQGGGHYVSSSRIWRTCALRWSACSSNTRSARLCKQLKIGPSS